MKGSVTDSQQAGLHTICSNYDKAAQTQQYLYDHIGEDYFHPQYVSKKDNTICFMAILNESTLIDFKKMNFMR